MAVRNHLGKTIYFSATLPATNDSAGFAALSWIELEYPLELPQFGITHDLIDVPALAGFTSAVKGSGSGVDSTGSAIIHDSTLTTNQESFRVIAAGAGGNVAIKIGSGTGAETDSGKALVSGDTVEYAVGIAHSFQKTKPTTGTHEGFTYGFKQNAPEVLDVEPA